MRGRSGVVLLEAIVALAITALAATALIDIAVESVLTVRRAQAHDRDVSSAARLISVVSLWTNHDLDRRLGLRRQGRWVVNTQRVAPGLFTIEVLDSAAAEVVLETTVYRPAPAGR